MKSLPVGISTLTKILEHDMVYIDKTNHAYNLIKEPGRYFLSRPRRFGKSLFLDTLKEIFEGNEQLFRGLYIHDKWDWNTTYPVIKIDFVAGLIRNQLDLEEKIEAIMSGYEAIFELTLATRGYANRFNELITKISGKNQSPVILLIDEYDKPLLDNIDRPEAAAEVREGLKAFYSVIKEQDRNIQFVFLTGVSKFSKVNIFSGINNLRDITLDKQFATICGYTQHDLETSFKGHLEGADWKKLKTWYNGYNFLGETVYNPFDILLFISNHKSYRNYWFETGTPSFLIKMFQQRNYFLPDLDNMEVGEEILDSFEIENIEPATLLFQSGYLTIHDVCEKMERLVFKLGFPNREVKTAFNESLISAYSNITHDKIHYEENTYNALKSGNLESLEQAITRLFSGVPYRNFTNNDLIEYEGWYASVLYAFFSAINCQVIPEDISNHGQADMTIMLEDYIYVMEIKVQKSDNVSEDEKSAALKQIQDRGYAEKYRNLPGKTVFEVGMLFSQKKRNLVDFSWE